MGHVGAEAGDSDVFIQMVARKVTVTSVEKEEGTGLGLRPGLVSTKYKNNFYNYFSKLTSQLEHIQQ